MVEIVIATTVLVVAVLGTFLSQLQANRLVATSRETAVGLADLRAAMEQILLLPPSQIPVPGSRFAAGQPIAEFEGLHLRDERIVPTYAGYAGAAVPDPLPIELVLTWTGARGESRRLTLASLRTR